MSARAKPLLPLNLRERKFRLALSGGGFRATLFSLGSLLYLVDSGLQRDVRAIHSVSGASVLNGVVAQKGNFAKARVRDIDEIAVQLLRTITGRGLLRSSCVTPVYLALLAAGFLYLAVEALLSWPLGLVWWQLLAGLALVVTAAIFRGQLIVHVLSVEFFRRQTKPTQLKDITSPIRHIFCATDLNSATPAYFTAGGGETPEFWTEDDRHVEVPKFRLDHAVRASAAFPGAIPPKRVSLKRIGLDWLPRTHRVPEVRKFIARRPSRPGRAARVLAAIRRWLRLDRSRFLFLADGGVCNNLATDRVAHARPETDEIVLVVDASAPLDTQPLHYLRIPMLAELGNISRAMSVLYANTVEPRIQELEMRGAFILGSPEAGAGVDFPIVMRVTDRSDQGVERVERMLDQARIPDSETADARKRLLRRSCEQWESADDYLADHHDLGVMAASSPEVPTTFGRIGPPQALGLMLHGYLASMTALTHTHAAPSGTVDFERFERLLRFETGDDPGFVPAPVP